MSTTDGNKAVEGGQLKVDSEETDPENTFKIEPLVKLFYETKWRGVRGTLPWSRHTLSDNCQMVKGVKAVVDEVSRLAANYWRSRLQIEVQKLGEPSAGIENSEFRMVNEENKETGWMTVSDKMVWIRSLTKTIKVWKGRNRRKAKALARMKGDLHGAVGDLLDAQGKLVRDKGEIRSLRRRLEIAEEEVMKDPVPEMLDGKNIGQWKALAESAFKESLKGEGRKLEEDNRVAVLEGRVESLRANHAHEMRGLRALLTTARPEAGIENSESGFAGIENGELRIVNEENKGNAVVADRG